MCGSQTTAADTPCLLQKECKMEVYHELVAEWKAEKHDVTSLFALFVHVPIFVIARAEMEKNGKEPDMVTLQVFEGF